MVLYNEVGGCVDQLEAGKEKEKCEDDTDGNKTKVKKKFCNTRSGSRDGWLQEGIAVYHHLIKKVELVRANPETGILLEKNRRQNYGKEAIRLVSERAANSEESKNSS